MQDLDIVFLSETHCNVKGLGDVNGFTKYGDPSFPVVQKHGGLAVYIKDFYAQYMKDLRFSKSTISFTVSNIPNVFFMGLYIYPSDSRNFKDTDFASVVNDINYWLLKGYYPFIGGDFNSRPGDLNNVSEKSLKWRYRNNKDIIKNSHGTLFADMCDVLNILPVNHCFYRGKYFDGGYTYFKANKKSQIDFLLTNNVGRAKITQFEIVKSGWHLSDHLPIDIRISAESTIDVRVLVVRTKLLLEDTYKEPRRIKMYNNKFNVGQAKHLLLADADTIFNECQDKSADEVLNSIYDHIDPILRKTTTMEEKVRPVKNPDMKDCDRLFQAYLEMVDNIQSDPDEIREAYKVYQMERCLLNKHLIEEHTNEYKFILNSHDDRKLWNLIDWSGSAKKTSLKEHPFIGEMTEFFTELYEPIENDGDIETLESTTYIPLTDDPITLEEIVSASNSMKKGGFDYPREVLQVVLSSISAVVLLLFNMILYNSWPSKLCMSLMSLIPKAGNLRLPTNFRGIQMQPLFANLFDRIVGNRLMQWIKISDEQTAFQKGKGTLDQLFILRIIIALIKYHKMTLYIGFFDLSKAFDRVSRYLLLKTLVRMGIGGVMLNALKRMYSCTRCVLKGFGKLSDVFQMYTGIKQGAASSVILFIAFLDDIIDYLKEKCVSEPLLDDLHCLLHADDTLLLSTNRDLFIQKCDVLIELFHGKKMSLNYKKSGYMIINGNRDDLKCDLKIKTGFLKYRRSQTYLGAIFSDSGVLRDDVSLFLTEKNKQVFVKLANFNLRNELAPISIKLKIVKACVNASLTYSCETWGRCPLNRLEILQRKAIKMVLNVYNNTPNEIVHVESGIMPLKPQVYKRQLNFFRKMKNDAAANPLSPISRIFNKIIEKNLPYIQHYVKLDQNFENAFDCFKYYLNEEKTSIESKIRTKGADDHDSVLGTYLRINPTLEHPSMYKRIECTEAERYTVTKYRTGSHSLKIQTGRKDKMARNERKCVCGHDVQTIDHVLYYCNLTKNITLLGDTQNRDLKCFFDNNVTYISGILESIEKVLNVKH